MKAVRVHAFGGPEQLVLDDLDEPRIRSSEVLVEIHAAGVNPVDTTSGRVHTLSSHPCPTFRVLTALGSYSRWALRWLAFLRGIVSTS
jgi:NADPH:quinone reductase-like Zn-dependent oxidoreductase